MADSMAGKTCLVTGATDGIGKAAAKALAGMGAAVIIVGRNPAKCDETAAEIKRDTGKDVEGVVADCSLMADVRRLAEQVKSKHKNLHVLINNVGAMIPKREVTKEGLEMTFALNVLGHFVLTNSLLDALKASAPARIIELASDSHRAARIDFGDLQSEKGYTAYRTYGRTKLADIMLAYELARRLAGTGVTANVLNPGDVRTAFVDKIGLNSLQRWSYGLFIRQISVEEGIKPLVYLAASPDVEKSTGEYWSKEKRAQSGKQSYNQADWGRLWQACEKLVAN